MNRNMPKNTRFALWLSVFWCAVVASAEKDPRIELELSSLQPELAEDLRKARDHVIEQTDSEISPKERSQAWSSLSMIYHAQYMLYSAKDAYSTALFHQDDFRWRYLLSVILIGEGFSEDAIVHLQQSTLVNPD